MGNEFTPAYESPVEVSDEVLVTGTVCATNDVGGTCILKHDGLSCRVTKKFWDYETGWRYHGVALDESAVAEIRRQATTEFTPAHYREKYPDASELIESAERAFAAFDPSKVYFSEHDFAPAPSRTLR